MDEENQEELSKSSGRNTVYLILAIIAVFAGILFYTTYITNNPVTIDDMHRMTLQGKESDTNYLYNGYSFVKFEGLWYFQVQDNGTLFDVALRFSPKEVEDVPIDADLRIIQALPALHLTFDPYTNDATYQALAAGELSLSLVNALGKQPVPACTRQDNDVCVNLPIVNCSYTEAPIIYLKEGDYPAVYLNKTCYTIQGTGFDLMKSTDRFIYKLYGIMP